MAKGAKGKKVTLKMAKACLRVTSDGRRCLDLSNQGLSSFPPVLMKLLPLDELNLSRNQIQALPASLDQLQGLVSLDLHTNQLETLPDALGEIASLQNLNLANNRLQASGLPASLSQLSALRSLNLGLNCLQDLPPALRALAALTHLALFDNQLECVPECVSALLPQLEKLNLKGNPLREPTDAHTLTLGSTAPPTAAEGEGKEVYLVRGEWLCPPCLQGLKRGREVEPDDREGRFMGMSTPNSVAILRQHFWRNAKNAPRIAFCR